MFTLKFRILIFMNLIFISINSFLFHKTVKSLLNSPQGTMTSTTRQYSCVITRTVWTRARSVTLWTTVETAVMRIAVTITSRVDLVSISAPSPSSPRIDVKYRYEVSWMTLTKKAQLGTIVCAQIKLSRAKTYGEIV